MWIRIRPASAAISIELPTPAGDGSEPKNRNELISLQVLPTNERDHLDLDTGEVFQDYNYARIRNKHEILIDTRLTIHPALAEEDYKRTVTQYIEGSKSEFESFPATIIFTVYVTPAAFRELSDNMKSGLLPETVTIGFEPGPFFTIRGQDQKRLLEYGWEPDGSGMVWHNKEREDRTIAIESVKFDYAVLQPRHDPATHQLLPMAPVLPPPHTNEQIAAIQIMLADMSRRMRWAAIGASVLAILAALWVLRHP